MNIKNIVDGLIQAFCAFVIRAQLPLTLNAKLAKVSALSIFHILLFLLIFKKIVKN